jgi:hypothetical protein
MIFMQVFNLSGNTFLFEILLADCKLLEFKVGRCPKKALLDSDLSGTYSLKFVV